MIDRPQLLQLARLSGLRPHQQEKHYLQALVLNSLAEEPLVFKGGTYLWLFQGLRRFSEDLDFTGLESPPQILPSRVSSDLGLMGVENRCRVLANDDRALSFRVSARGPLNTSTKDECLVYVEISRREQVSDRTLPIRLDFPPYGLPMKMIRGMGLDEVGAEKVRAILTRDKARDVFDLHHLVARKGISFRGDLVASKLRYYRRGFDGASFLQRVKASTTRFQKELKGLVFEDLPAAADVLDAIEGWVGSQG